VKDVLVLLSGGMSHLNSVSIVTVLLHCVLQLSTVIHTSTGSFSILVELFYVLCLRHSTMSVKAFYF